MASKVEANDPWAIPQPPMVRPSWMTWVYMSLAVAVVVATAIGLWSAGKPYML
jgi:hypothetical protein